MRPPTVQDSPGQQQQQQPPTDQKPHLSPSLGGAYPPQYQQQQQNPQYAQQYGQQQQQQPMYPNQGEAATGGGGGAPQSQPNLNEPGFRTFYSTVGSNFAVDKVWNAYQRSGGDLNKGLQILLEAKPLVPTPSPAPSQTQPPQQQSYSPAAQYAQIGSPHLSAPGTPGSSHAVIPGQTQVQGQQYPAEYLRNSGQYSNMQHLQQQHQQHQQQQQQSRAQIQTMMRPVQNAQGYPPQMMMNGQQQQQQQAQGMHPQQQQMTAHQQQQQLAYARAMQAAGQQPNYGNRGPGGIIYPPIPGQAPAQQSGHIQFPQAAIGYAGFTDAHYNHYLELQRAYFSGKISPEDNKSLTQYASVLNRHAQQGNRPPQTATYSHQGVYSQQGGGGGGVDHSQQPFKRGPGRPPKNAQPYYPKHQPPQTSGSILARQLAAASAASSAVKKKGSKKKAYGSDSDDDGGDYDSAGSGDEYGSRENPAAVARREQLAVEFFNTCEKELLMELAGECRF